MIDLHTHSTASDGTYSPVDLIRLAAREGVKLLALTDHDTVSGIKAAAEEAAHCGIRFIAGIEIKIKHPSQECHLLGLGLTADPDDFTRKLKEIKDNRKKRNLQILEKINLAGIALTLAELEAAAAGGTIGRPHFARLLVKKGVVTSIDAAFRHYLATGKPFYTELEPPTLEEGIKLIKEAGGITVLAHAVSLRLPIRKLKEFLLSGKKKGLDGIEVYHPYHSLKFSRQLEIFALHNHFVLTGGSDFHGKKEAEQRLGFIAPGVVIPEHSGEWFARLSYKQFQ